jgi:hypothetical protein
MAGQPGRSQPSSALDAAQPHAQQGNILQFVFANNQSRTGIFWVEALFHLSQREQGKRACTLLSARSFL